MSFNTDTQFIISKISHELRNPLTIIYSTLQLMERKHPELKNFDHWPELIRDVEFMNQLLDEFSTLNHADSLTLSTFSFRSFLEYISLSFAASASNTELPYSSRIAPSITQITGDKTKLQELFLNLLKNAADACRSKGSVFLDAEQKDDTIYVTISDTGCGISEEQLPTVFEPFTTYKENGTGLGLAIADNIVKAHGGSIKIHSSLGEGTTVFVTLPTEQECHKHSRKQASNMCHIVDSRI